MTLKPMLRSSVNESNVEYIVGIMKWKVVDYSAILAKEYFNVSREQLSMHILG